MPFYRSVPVRLAVFATVAPLLSAGLGQSQSCQTCVMTLDPLASQAFKAGNGAQTKFNNCGIGVNSSNASVFYATGGAQVSAASIQVVGGSSVSNGATATPTPKTGVLSFLDPLAAVAQPSASTCTTHPDYTSWGTNGHYEVYPGTYCGGLAVSNGVTAHFNPGVYVINGGGIQFGSGSVSGTGVTFFITGSTFTSNQLVSINNGMTANLSAPTTG